MNYQFTAVFEEVPEGFIGYLEELPGANTQAPTLEATAVPRHREINDFLARKICRDLDVVEP